MWFIIFDFISLSIWPFNPSNWRSIIAKIRFKKNSLEESWDWNYGKLNLNKTIKKIKKRTYKPYHLGLIVIILIISGLITINYYSFGYVLIGIGIIELILNRKKINLIKIEIIYRKSRAKGTAFMLDLNNKLILYDVPEIANLIPPIKT